MVVWVKLTKPNMIFSITAGWVSLHSTQPIKGRMMRTERIARHRQKRKDKGYARCLILTNGTMAGIMPTFAL